MTEEVGSSLFGIGGKIVDGRGSDGSSTGVLAMHASRVGRGIGVAPMESWFWAEAQGQ